MSSLKNIFKSSTKDSNSPSRSTPNSVRKSSSLRGLASAAADSSAPANSSSGPLTTSPASTLQLPAIDVIDTSDTYSEGRSDHSHDQHRQIYDEPAALTKAQQASGSMPRPSSSGHGHWRSEPGIKPGRRGSRNDKSDDGHGKPELLNRHELMRRAMVSAQDALVDGSDDEDSQTPVAPSASIPGSRRASAVPATVAGPGEGSLSIDAFQNGHSHVFASDAPGPNPPQPASVSSPATKRKDPAALLATSTPAKAPNLPAVVTPAPIRAELPRSDSLEELIASQNAAGLNGPGLSPNKTDTPVKPPGSPSLGAAQHGNGPPRAQTMLEPSLKQPVPLFPGMTKSQSSNSLMLPNQAAGRLPDSSSSPLLSPGPLARLRKNSDSGSKGLKGGPAGGIAGALAASGMAGMGVGHAVAAQQTQAAAAALAAQDKSGKRADSLASLGRQHPNGVSTAHTAGYQGGIYRDPSTGTIIERDHEGNGYIPQRPGRDRSVSSLLSYDGSVASERSSASGLGAAAGFGTASAALLAPIGASVPGLVPNSALLSPDGAASLAPGGPLTPSAQHPILEGDVWTEDMGPQITGFAVASSKRNYDFHQLFSQVPEDDYLIEDYGCALVREILTQGRMYISENHICFNANIFGWVTNVVLPFAEIVSIEKRMTAFVIPNAIQIATLHAKHTFTSFLSRDTTYDLIVNIWKLSHPGVPIAAADQADLTDEYSEVEDDDRTEAADGSKASGDTGTGGNNQKPSKRARLKRKLIGTKSGVRDENLAAVAAAAARSGTPMITPSRSPAPGGKRLPHRKTSCPCEEKKEHLSTVALDTTYPAVPEKIYNLLFTSGFMKEFWTGNQKLMDLQISDWSPNAQNNNMLSRSMSYIKPLSGGFGPKQTKCVLTDENLHVDFDDYVITLTTTRTPDVPSGGSFSVKTRTCITWAGGGNVSRVYVTCQVEWTGRSMIKGIIEKASIDGQKQYYRDLDDAVRTYLQEHTSEFKEEGDDEAAVEEIARAATPGPGKKGPMGGGSSSIDEKSSTDGGHDSGSSSMLGGGLSMVKDGLGMVGDLLGGAIEMVSDTSNMKQTLLTSIVIVLLLSNIYTWWTSSRPPGAAETLNPSYGYVGGYWAPPSPRVYQNHPDAVASAVREVLEDYLPPRNQPSPADPASIERMLREAEDRLERLKLAIEQMRTTQTDTP